MIIFKANGDITEHIDDVEYIEFCRYELLDLYNIKQIKELIKSKVLKYYTDDKVWMMNYNYYLNGEENV